MLQLLLTLWCLSLTLLTIYHLVVFRMRKTDSGNDQKEHLPGVSILIAVKNGSDQLQQNISSILAQDYPLFEVIIVDDHSDSAESEKLKALIHLSSSISVHISDQPPGKKQALTLGIQKAKYEVILCTDADCKPIGPNWLKSMVRHYPEKGIVLGYSPYTVSKGLLNAIIRFETLMTGIQYLSWAMVGRPYMGVGRNMMYPRSLFLKTDPYKNQQHIPYGDDDLWIQQASSAAKVLVCMEKESFVMSEPAKAWGEWFSQKHRHMSAAHHYAKGNWWQPGLYGIGLLAHWFLLPVIFFGNQAMLMIAFLFLGLLLRWYTYFKWSKALGDRDTVIWYPFLEVGYTLYLAAVGILTILVKKKAWN